jgi:N4-gp56 family major capsid protein
MSSTGASDVNFVPKVWSDHIQAYFSRKLVLGQLAAMDNTLEANPGETVNFPYFKNIGDVEEPTESQGLNVDSLQDDAFSVTVKEVGKAVGWKDKAYRKSAASKMDQEAEAQRQIARVFAEKVDKDLIALMASGGNFTSGFTAAANTDKCTVRTILQGKINAFGDRHDESVAIAMHSLNFADMMNDSTTGFLQGNSLDPMWGMPGFQGRLLGMALFTLDQVTEVAAIGGKRSFESYIFKANPFGIYMAQQLQMEKDRDILHRETIVAATMWYGVLSLHQKVSANDKRICKNIFASNV